MRPLTAAASLATTLALSMLPAMPQQAMASTSVLRCEMPDGARVYTNKACGAYGAKAVPLPADVLDRIRADRRHEIRLQAQRAGMDEDAALAELDAGRMIGTLASIRRPVSSGCAATPDQLASDLQASLAIGDVNRVAESFDWAGMDNAVAQRVFGRLEAMAGMQVVDADYFDATISSGIGPAGIDPDPVHAAFASEAGLMQLTFADAGGTSVDDFDVTRQRGCYFLRYA